MSDTFKVGDLVWAKMKGFPPWPGRVSEPPKDAKKTPKKSSALWIYFFGSNNYGWIESNSIKPYLDHKESLSKGSKTSGFLQACAAIEEYFAKGDNLLEPAAETTPEEAFDNFVKATPTPKAKKPKKSSTPKVETPTSSQAKDSPKDTSESSDEKDEKKKTAPKSEKKVKTKRSVSPSVNGDTPLKKKKLSLNALSDTPKSSMSEKIKEDAIMTVYKGSSEEKKSKSPVAASSLLPKVTRIDMDQDLPPSKLKFGFLGLGIMGSGIVNNILESGHKVIVWNRTSDRADDFVTRGAEVGKSPADVVYNSDITFCCVSDPTASKELIFGPNGVLSAIDSTKSYVELTTIDSETSLNIADAIRSKGGRYLEAQLQGSKVEADQGSLVILCGGDRSLYEECQTCFRAMGKCSFFLGDAGNAAKMNLVIQLISGVTLGALAEGMALADSAGLKQADVLEIMSYTPVTSPLVMSKSKQIIDSLFNTNMPLKHMQKDLTLSLALGDVLEHPLPLTAAANEIYKHARKLGYSMHDASAVYIRAKF